MNRVCIALKSVTVLKSDISGTDFNGKLVDGVVYMSDINLSNAIILNLSEEIVK